MMSTKSSASLELCQLFNQPSSPKENDQLKNAVPPFENEILTVRIIERLKNSISIHNIL